MKILRPVYHLLVVPLLVPLQLLTMLLRIRTGRLRVARAAGDRGALSIEMALIVMVVVAIAGLVLAALTTLGRDAQSSVPKNLPAGLAS